MRVELYATLLLYRPRPRVELTVVHSTTSSFGRPEVQVPSMPPFQVSRYEGGEGEMAGVLQCKVSILHSHTKKSEKSGEIGALRVPQWVTV